jgi:hypothetical protein
MSGNAMTIPYDWEHDGDGFDREGRAADTSALVLYDWERDGDVMLPETVLMPARPRAAPQAVARIVLAAGFVALGFAISAAAVLALVAVILAARGGHN